MRATNDVRFALRTLRRHPAFTTAAILASQLFGVGQHDVAVFAGVPIVLIVVAGGALGDSVSRALPTLTPLSATPL
jgi:hypothetical protein